MIIDFDKDIEADAGVLKDISLERALKVIAWIEVRREHSGKGYAYDVDGNPVINDANAVMLKTSFKHYKWCDPETELSIPAYRNNPNMFQVIIWKELHAIAGMDETETSTVKLDT